jgi:ribose transport system ATP-binding protein
MEHAEEGVVAGSRDIWRPPGHDSGIVPDRTGDEYSAPNILDIKNLSKSFSGQRVLRDVNFAIAKGEIHALVGENGSGKSTLIKVLAGYHQPDPGAEFDVDGERLSAIPADAPKRLGFRFVHQNLNLIDELSVADNFGIDAGFATRFGFVRRAVQARRAEVALSRLGMAVEGVGVDPRRLVSSLRAIERTAVAIARALEDDPGGRPTKLLILDEPTAALPPHEVQTLLRILRDVVLRSDIALLYVSHRLEEVLDLASRVSVLRDGAHYGPIEADQLDKRSLTEMIVGRKQDHIRVPPSSSRTSSHGANAAANDEEMALRVRSLATEVLDHVDFELHRGEILGFFGPDGSGREDIALSIAGMAGATGILQTSKTLELEGAQPGVVRNHGIVVALSTRHPASAIREFSIEENLHLATVRKESAQGVIRRSQERRRANATIRRFDIRPPIATHPFKLMSGGNQQKLIIAAALHTEPTVLVVDDPTSGVDVGARQAIYAILRGKAEEGLGVIVSSSDVEDLESLCSRVLILDAGRVIEELVNPTQEQLLVARGAQKRDRELIPGGDRKTSE